MDERLQTGEPPAGSTQEPTKREKWIAPRLERLDFDGTEQTKGTASAEFKEFYSGGVTS